MDMRTRIERLENRIGVGNAIPPLVRIDIKNCSKNSVDKGRPAIAVIPGKLNGPCGKTLFRNQDEAETDFLERCEAEYNKFYS